MLSHSNANEIVEPDAEGTSKQETLPAHTSRFNEADSKPSQPTSGAVLETSSPRNAGAASTAEPLKTSPARINQLLNLLLFASPVILTCFYFQGQPFNHELASKTIELSHYKSEHRQNFLTAARALDGKIIKPGETFSFNRVIGPRTYQRGYLPAPSYLGQSKIETNGGGICLVSSNLYQAALLSGLTIVERHPHNKRVNSVAPGLDATVWYGQTDLKIKNDLSEAIQIRCSNEHQSLSIAINTSQAVVNPQLALRRREIHKANQNLLVEVYLDAKDKSPRLISRDSYLIH